MHDESYFEGFVGRDGWRVSYIKKREPIELMCKYMPEEDCVAYMQEVYEFEEEAAKNIVQLIKCEISIEPTYDAQTNQPTDKKAFRLLDKLDKPECREQLAKTAKHKMIFKKAIDNINGYKKGPSVFSKKEDYLAVLQSGDVQESILYMRDELKLEVADMISFLNPNYKRTALQALDEVVHRLNFKEVLEELLRQDSEAADTPSITSAASNADQATVRDQELNPTV